jgi:hypothetical protein
MPKELSSFSNAGRMLPSTEREEDIERGKAGFIPLVFGDE